MTDKDVKVLSELLKHDTSITNLNLGHGDISDDGASILALLLQHNRHITSLNLDYNRRIGDEGGKALARELMHRNDSLEVLHLGFCDIGLEGFKMFAEVLRTNSTLTTLGLQGNGLGSAAWTREHNECVVIFNKFMEHSKLLTPEEEEAHKMCEQKRLISDQSHDEYPELEALVLANSFDFQKVAGVLNSSPKTHPYPHKTGTATRSELKLAPITADDARQRYADSLLTKTFQEQPKAKKALDLEHGRRLDELVQLNSFDFDAVAAALQMRGEGTANTAHSARQHYFDLISSAARLAKAADCSAATIHAVELVGKQHDKLVCKDPLRIDAAGILRVDAHAILPGKNTRAPCSADDCKEQTRYKDRFCYKHRREAQAHEAEVEATTFIQGMKAVLNREQLKRAMREPLKNCVVSGCHEHTRYNDSHCYCHREEATAKSPGGKKVLECPNQSKFFSMPQLQKLGRATVTNLKPWSTAKPKEADHFKPKESAYLAINSVLLKDQQEPWQNGAYTITPRSPFEITSKINNRFVGVATKRFHEPIGDLGASYMEGVLQQNRTLTHLSLGQNNIGVEGAIGLASALKDNAFSCALVSLDLSGNDLEERGKHELAEAMTYLRQARKGEVEQPECSDLCVDRMPSTFVAEDIVAPPPPPPLLPRPPAPEPPKSPKQLTDLERRQQAQQKRLEKEEADMRNDPPEYCAAHPAPGSERLKWDVAVVGPQGSPYENGVFYAEIVIEPVGANAEDDFLHYPYRPPRIRFNTRIYHMNISQTNGLVCLDILQDQWSPSMCIKQVLMSVVSLLKMPVVDNGSYAASGRSPGWALTKTVTDNHHLDVFNPNQMDKFGRVLQEHEQSQAMHRGDPAQYADDHERSDHHDAAYDPQIADLWQHDTKLHNEIAKSYTERFACGAEATRALWGRLHPQSKHSYS
jgi:ubiquitin-conjugating enzyme E2 D/E